MWDWCLIKLNQHLRMATLRKHSIFTHNVSILYCKLLALWIRKLPNAFPNLQVFNSNLEISYKQSSYKLRVSFSKKEYLVMIILKQLTVTQIWHYTIILVVTSARHSNICTELWTFSRLLAVKIIQIFHQSTST